MALRFIREPFPAPCPPAIGPVEPQPTPDNFFSNMKFHAGRLQIYTGPNPGYLRWLASALDTYAAPSKQPLALSGQYWRVLFSR
jgi:hypothetical protein